MVSSFLQSIFLHGGFYTSCIVTPGTRIFFADFFYWDPFPRVAA